MFMYTKEVNANFFLLAQNFASQEPRKAQTVEFCKKETTFNKLSNLNVHYEFLTVRWWVIKRHFKKKVGCKFILFWCMQVSY